MAVFINIIRHSRLRKSFLSFAQTYHYDRHLDYFRKKDGYKNSLMQLKNDHEDSKLVNAEISCTREKHGQLDKIFSHFLQRENVMKLSSTQLKDTVSLLANSQIDIQKYEDVLKYIDEKCAMSVVRWPLEFSIYVLDAWLIILGPKVFRKHYYFALTNLLNKKMKRCSKHNLLLILYFIGMSKRPPPFLMEFIMYKLENFISDLNDEEWAIACLSFFKTSTKISSYLLLQQCSEAAKRLMLKNDHFNLISILKCLRLSEYIDNNLIGMLDEYIQREYTTFNFVECTNFLATYATQNRYNYEAFKCLETQGIFQLSKEESFNEFNKNVEKMHPSERSRVKDLARFLWGMAFVGHEINEKAINFLLGMLSTRIDSGEFESNIVALVDCLQSLILLDYYPLNMIEYVLKPSFLQKISNINRAKPKYQLYFINRSCYIENYLPNIKKQSYMSNIPKNLEKEISERKGFQDLIDYLNVHLKKDTFTWCYIMPHIMISGIIVATDRKENTSDKLITPTLLKLIENGIISQSIKNILHTEKMYTCIELLDPSVCVHETTMPLGLMKTKIRQLQKLNINVITLSSNEINELKKSSERSCSKLHNLIM